MKVIRHGQSQIEWLEFPIRLMLSLVLLTAAFAAEFRSAFMVGLHCPASRCDVV